MKIIYISLMILAVIACKKTEIIDVIRETEPEQPSAVHYYYSHVAEEIINAEKLGYKTDEFIPGCTYVYGDTLFIANTREGHFSVELYSRSKHQKISSLTHWVYNNAEQSFNNYVEAIAVSSGYLYLANIGSCIDIFDIHTLKFVTRIGNRNWGSTNTQLLHSHALAIVGKYIVVRMKNRLQVYLQSEITAHDYQKIPFYSRSSVAGFDTNNGFNSYQMVADSTGLIYLTDFGQYGNQKIQFIDTVLLESGDDKVMTTSSPLSLAFNPRGIALYKNLMYVSAQDGSIRLYDQTKKEFFQTCKSISGYTFIGAQKLLITGNRLWVTDIANKEVVGVDIYQHEIEEYDSSDDPSK